MDRMFPTIPTAKNNCENIFHRVAAMWHSMKSDFWQISDIFILFTGYTILHFQVHIKEVRNLPKIRFHQVPY